MKLMIVTNDGSARLLEAVGGTLPIDSSGGVGTMTRTSHTQSADRIIGRVMGLKSYFLCQ